MNLRSKIAVSVSVLAITAGGWAWTGSAAAPSPVRASQPTGDGTITYQAPEMVRPSPGELPVAPLVDSHWVGRENLTFHPVVPCRIVDTRVINARLGDADIFSFNFIASDYTSQGGFAGECGVPNRALAVELNVTAATPSAQGYLKLYPFDEPQPNASVLNYAATQTIANSTTVARCVTPVGTLCDVDLTLYAHRATDLIVDVLGYYEGSLSAQVRDDGEVEGFSVGLSTVTRNELSAGQYSVVFVRDVSLCVFTASIGFAGAMESEAGSIDLEDLGGEPNGVYVATFDDEGNPKDLPFQLVVHC